MGGVMKVIVYGRPGCGKTRYARAMMAHFGLEHLVDDWDGCSDAADNTLYLTNVDCPQRKDAFAFDEVMALIGKRSVLQGSQAALHKRPSSLC